MKSTLAHLRRDPNHDLDHSSLDRYYRLGPEEDHFSQYTLAAKGRQESWEGDDIPLRFIARSTRSSTATTESTVQDSSEDINESVTSALGQLALGDALPLRHRPGHPDSYSDLFGDSTDFLTRGAGPHGGYNVVSPAAGDFVSYGHGMGYSASSQSYPTFSQSTQDFQESQSPYGDLGELSNDYSSTPYVTPSHKRPEESISRYGCPMCKANPDRYDAVHGPCTERPGLSLDPKRMREHLKTYHSKKNCCKRCGKKRHTTKCEDVEEMNRPELFTIPQEEAFENLKVDKQASVSEKFFAWFDALHPRHQNRNYITPSYDYLVRNTASMGQCEPRLPSNSQCLGLPSTNPSSATSSMFAPSSAYQDTGDSLTTYSAEPFTTPLKEDDDVLEPLMTEPDPELDFRQHDERYACDYEMFSAENTNNNIMGY